jgi:ABC-2 type transport system ATP-binding protein
LGKLAHTLSRGQRQRLAIGQAIIHAPKVLLLDEPASGLDPEARSALAHVFKALQSQGMSLVVSSHILAELDEYSTQMLALNQGRVLEHRALVGAAVHGSSGAVERVLRLEFVQQAETVTPWLQTQAHVRIRQLDGHAVEIAFDGDRTAQATLVGACVAAGHAVVSIAAITENLQQSYLKSLAAERAADPASRRPA